MIKRKQIKKKGVSPISPASVWEDAWPEIKRPPEYQKIRWMLVMIVFIGLFGVLLVQAIWNEVSLYQQCEEQV